MTENETSFGTGTNMELMEILEDSSYSSEWPSVEDPTNEESDSGSPDGFLLISSPWTGMAKWTARASRET